MQLLVADIAMPDVDGYDLIRQVRQIDARLPAVAVTAYAYPQDRLKALAAGFTAYCSKPIDATHFLRIVRNVMLSSELSAPPVERASCPMPRRRRVLRRAPAQPRHLTRARRRRLAAPCLRLRRVQHQRFRNGTRLPIARRFRRLQAGTARAVRWWRARTDHPEHASGRRSPTLPTEDIMATNRASLSDTLTSRRRRRRAARPRPSRPRRQDRRAASSMVLGGFFLALVWLAIGSIGSPRCGSRRPAAARRRTRPPTRHRGSRWR